MSRVKVSRILHAGYIFKSQKTQVVFDPIFENPFSRNCYAFPSVEFDLTGVRDLHPDAIFISHIHDDHCSLESLSLLPISTPVYIYSAHEEVLKLINALGFAEVHHLHLDTPVIIGDFQITPRRALDADVDCLLQIQASGLNILNVVDAWIDWETVDNLVKEKPWDLILWPFQTMREFEVLTPSRSEASSSLVPPEWIEQLQSLNPRFIVPSSCQFIHETWSWYRQAYFPISYRGFQEQLTMQLPESQVIRLNPGVTIELSVQGALPCERVPWILPKGDQDVDYEYLVDLKPPETGEISRQLPGLDSMKSDRVLDYCRKEIVEVYSSLEIDEDSYFNRPKLWQLSLFDPQGTEHRFLYRVHNNELAPILDLTEQEVSWLTEVPISTMYGALEEGESLTSMYLRINDQPFHETIELEVSRADPLEDPLLRCLFRDVGSYQRAQLKRIRARA